MNEFKHRSLQSSGIPKGYFKAFNQLCNTLDIMPALSLKWSAGQVALKTSEDQPKNLSKWSVWIVQC